jgi:Ca2+-binding RTX toxin-like protein
MWGGPGDDYMRGDEWDAVTYEASKTPVEVRGRFATGEGEDELAGIDIVIGSEFDDRIINKDTSIGLGGDDYIQMGSRGEAQGGAGNDTIVGTNTDRVYETVFYDDAPQRVIVDLGSGSAVGHGTDTLSRIEAVVGSPYDDRITGDGRGNWFWGLEGNDVLSGLGGNDDLDGYLGYDTLIAGPGFDDCIDGESLSGCERTWYRAAEKQPRLPRVVRMYLGVVARYG